MGQLLGNATVTVGPALNGHGELYMRALYTSELVAWYRTNTAERSEEEG